jgi:hypothetical protein
VSPSPVRQPFYADAFLLATIAALVVDAVLQLALGAVRVSAYGAGAPWWVTAHVIERGRWVVFALLLWRLASRPAEDGDEPRAPAASPAVDAWRHVAIAVIAVPLLWIVATWIVSAARFTLLGSWDTDGRVFLSPDYYRGLVLDLAPWAMAAAVLMRVRRHL